MMETEFRTPTGSGPRCTSRTTAAICSVRVRATCDFKEPATDKKCGADAQWIADIGWPKEASEYEGTSWSVALCEAHYEQLRVAGRVTGTAHQVPD